MSSTSIDSIVLLNSVSAQMTRYLTTFIFLFGNIGNLLNILVLSQRTLRSNSCAIIFCASSVAGLISLLSGLTPRVISAWASDLSETVLWICKLRGFALFTARGAAFWLIMLASVDRWLLSCNDANRRHLSTVKNAHRSVTLVVVLSILIHSETLYCYQSNLINAPSKCFSDGLACRLLSDMLFAVYDILLPLSIMIVFGLMTIFNIRSSRTRVQPTHCPLTVNPSKVSNTRLQRLSKTDRRLLIMLSVQVILLALLTLPLSIQKIYSTVTSNDIKSPLHLTIDNLVYNFVLLLTYLANGIPFYLYTLSGGPIFRKAFLHLIRLVAHKFIWQ